jgi:hypothetical protein
VWSCQNHCSRMLSCGNDRFATFEQAAEEHDRSSIRPGGRGHDGGGAAPPPPPPPPRDPRPWTLIQGLARSATKIVRVGPNCEIFWANPVQFSLAYYGIFL